MLRDDKPQSNRGPDKALLEDAQARLVAIVTGTADAIVSKTLEGVVTSWNSAAQRIFGYTPEEMVGQSIRSIIPAHLQDEEDMILAKIAAGESIDHYETVRRTKDGRLINVSVTVSPLFDAAGRIIGASKIARDITERKAAEERLAAIRDALAAQRSAGDPFELEETTSVTASSETAVERQAAIAGTGLLNSKSERAFEQTTRLAAGVLQAPTSMLTVIEEQQQVFVSSYGLPATFAGLRAVPMSHSYCRFVIESAAPVFIVNARGNPLVSSMELWKQGFTAYLGVPIFDRNGVVVAALSVADSKVRAWTLRDLLTLKGVAQQLMRELENRAVLRTLAESEERLRAASSAAGFGVHDTRVAAGTTTWSAELVRMLGLGNSDMTVPAIEASLATVHREDRAAVARTMHEVMRRTGPYEYECRVMRPDGEVRWVLDRGEALPPLDPETGLVARVTGVVIDITERKLHEEKVLLLMREVNHRAKNMLGMIQAMARQTLATEPKEFVARFSDRIHALSINQDLLVKNEWDGVDINDLIAAQLMSFEDHIGNRITMSGPPIRLLASAAQAIGLALHELGTNAGTHGALSGDTGHVDITWSLDGGEFKLCWRESGGPAVSRPTRKGFGSTIITYAVETSVDGKTTLDYAQAGFCWCLTAPSESVGKVAPTGA